jgi:hypothetical protein
LSIGAGKTQFSSSAPVIAGSFEFFTQRFRGFYKNANSVSVTSQGYYAAGSGASFQGTAPTSQSAPTATEPGILTLQSGAGASANAFGQNEQFSNPANYIINRFRRFDMRIAANLVAATYRHWFGIYQNAASGATLPGLVMASDAPATEIIGFRLSSGVDNSFAAVAQSGISNQIAVPSGIVPVAGVSHLFTVTFDGNQTVRYFIDGKVVATLQLSNAFIPTDNYFMFFCCDNKNIAVNASFNIASAIAYDIA